MILHATLILVSLIAWSPFLFLLCVPIACWHVRRCDSNGKFDLNVTELCVELCGVNNLLTRQKFYDSESYNRHVRDRLQGRFSMDCSSFMPCFGEFDLLKVSEMEAKNVLVIQDGDFDRQFIERSCRESFVVRSGLSA